MVFRLAASLLALFIWVIPGMAKDSVNLHQAADYKMEKSSRKNGFKRHCLSAMTNAAKNPATWMTAGTALGIYISGQDKNISRWACKNTPVFGSKTNAADFSDLSRSSAEWGFWISYLSLAGADIMDVRLSRPLITLGSSILAVKSTYYLTKYLKINTHRLRPNRNDFRSFPSGHTSSAAVFARLWSKRLQSINPDSKHSWTFSLGAAMISMATGWARVEAECHYPSDIFAGWALGNFLGVFINDFFLSGDAKIYASPSIDVSKDVITMSILVPLK
jgi:membrane-associated phospholipid phosphatase